MKQNNTFTYIIATENEIEYINTLKITTQNIPQIVHWYYEHKSTYTYIIVTAIDLEYSNILK